MRHTMYRLPGWGAGYTEISVCLYTRQEPYAELDPRNIVHGTEMVTCIDCLGRLRA